MNTLIIDNYDSFTYNIVQLVRCITGEEPTVTRNDVIDLDTVGSYDKIILSPGPGIPSEAGLLKNLIARHGPQKSILGICLGHQAIGEVYGAKLINMPAVLHGVASDMHRRTSDILFEGLSPTITGAHYHSWVVGKEEFPEALEILLEDAQGQIMALRHRYYDVKGLQFHPESILTPEGMQMMQNWFNN
jgi:anthranilate synthase component 2